MLKITGHLQNWNDTSKKSGGVSIIKINRHRVFFRPCAMVVPDFELICEINLIAEGFQNARLLARKFLTLYSLCRELLSKQDHYDWGLRAIKSLLVVAGSLKVKMHTTIQNQLYLIEINNNQKLYDSFC